MFHVTHITFTSPNSSPPFSPSPNILHSFQLAAVVLSELDPLAVPVDHCTHDLLLPNFNSPVVQYALLPGELGLCGLASHY